MIASGRRNKNARRIVSLTLISVAILVFIMVMKPSDAAALIGNAFTAAPAAAGAPAALGADVNTVADKIAIVVAPVIVLMMAYITFVISRVRGAFSNHVE
jgi:hypothetical protein